jgi:ribosomal protein S6--L-glutamate ligase
VTRTAGPGTGQDKAPERAQDKAQDKANTRLAPGETLHLGWEEWVALPDLGLPALKAKIDTGAKTSALHAYSVEGITQDGIEMVRFRMHPARRRRDIDVVCTVPVKDIRNVASSNGERERRYVIETVIEIGGHRWPIEVTLTNRDSMTSRMLIGRQALQRGILVDPGRSFLLPRLGYGAYGQKRKRVPRP